MLQERSPLEPNFGFVQVLDSTPSRERRRIYWPFDSMADDALQHVFRFLGIRERYQISVVSKRWNCLIDSTPLPEFFFQVIRNKHTGDELACHAHDFEQIPKIRSICTDTFSIEALSKIGDKIQGIVLSQNSSKRSQTEVAKYCTNLRVLDNSENEYMNLLSLGIILNNNVDSLTQLVIRSIDEASICSYFCGNKFQKMTYLQIHISRKDHDEFIVLLTELPEVCPNLKQIVIPQPSGKFLHRVKFYEKVLHMSFAERRIQLCVLSEDGRVETSTSGIDYDYEEDDYYSDSTAQQYTLIQLSEHTFALYE